MTKAQLCALGFTPMQLSRLVKSDILERPWRGVYRLAGSDDPRSTWAGLTVAHPGAVFWLYSAAVLHGLTENLGVALYVGVPQGDKLAGDDSTLHVSRWVSESALSLGIEEHVIDGIAVKVTSPERTVVDFFRLSSMGSGAWRKNAVEPDVLFDVVSRYIARYGAPGRDLRRMAMRFKVWDAMKAYLGTIQLARPDLFAKAA
jgi:predicted transcriptional regulator of viral defense system